MSEHEVQQLYLKMRKKKITSKEISKAIGCSESLLSRFWNGKCNISQDKLIQLKNYIYQTDKYKLVRVD